MDLHLDRMVVNNFKTFVGEPTIIDLSTRGPGLHYVRGRNNEVDAVGANDVGKTTMLPDALSWCWFGRSKRNGRDLRNSDVIPWSGATGPTQVTTYVRTDNTEHVIERTATTNGLRLDGDVVDQSRVDRLLRLNYTLFPYTLLYAQDVPLFFDLQSADKLKLLSDRLYLDRFDRYADNADKLAKATQIKIDDCEDAVIRYKAQLDSAVAEIERLTVSSDAWDQEHSDQVEVDGKTLEKLRAELEGITKKHDEASLVLDSAGTELVSMRKQIRDMRSEVARLEAQRAAEVAAAETEYQLTTERYANLKKGDRCPTCDRVIDEQHLKDRKHHIDHLKRQIVFKKDWTIKKIELDRFSEVLASLEKSESEFQEKADAAQSKMNVLAPRLGELQTRVIDLEQARAKRRETLNPYTSDLLDAQRRKAQLAKQIKDTETELGTLRRRHTRAIYWKDVGYKEIKLRKIEEILQELELATTYGLEEMGLSNWRVMYNVERETQKGTIVRGMNTTVLSPRNAGVVKWEIWGGGVKQRLRLIGALAFAEVLLSHAGVRPTFEILDEPCRGLSVEGIEDLVEFLALRARLHGKTILFIEHHAIETTDFASVFTVTKTKRGSRLA